ncbi:hypothetical protein [Streptomyces sp. LN704]|uniref:hypothetical protein n=1 Tax=Streptomyces sp. LN704 TaxID=3112982 RepID=UPI00371E9C51
MPRAKGSLTPYCWTEKDIASDVPPGKRALAAELQRLCRFLALESDGSAPTQKQAADRLHVGDTSLSRYLSALYLPGIDIVRGLYSTASADAGGAEKTGITLARLESLHSAADAEQCHGCVKSRRDALALQQQNSETAAALDVARAELDAVHEGAAARREEILGLQREVQTLRVEVQTLKARESHSFKSGARRAIRAGQRSRLAAEKGAALLPVPPRRGDRQQSNPEKRAASNVARQAAALQNGGRQDGALALLRHSADVLSPVEAATLVSALRESQLDELAGTLIHIYGRDNPDLDVMRAAAQLHHHGAPDDAATLLQVALATRTDTP